MSAGRVIGGIIALIGGMLVLIMCFINMQIAFALGSEYIIAWVINLLLGLLAFIGGIMGLTSRTGGGIALVAGLVVLFLGLLSFAVSTLSILFNQYSVFSTYMDIGKWSGISLESILMILGGIIMLASGSGYHHHHHHHD